MPLRRKKKIVLILRRNTCARRKPSARASFSIQLCRSKLPDTSHAKHGSLSDPNIWVKSLLGWSDRHRFRVLGYTLEEGDNGAQPRCEKNLDGNSPKGLYNKWGLQTLFSLLLLSKLQRSVCAFDRRKRLVN